MTEFEGFKNERRSSSVSGALTMTTNDSSEGSDTDQGLWLQWTCIVGYMAPGATHILSVL